MEKSKHARELILIAKEIELDGGGLIKYRESYPEENRLNMKRYEIKLYPTDPIFGYLIDSNVIDGDRHVDDETIIARTISTINSLYKSVGNGKTK
jgi:hypothetical protein